MILQTSIKAEELPIEKEKLGSGNGMNSEGPS